MIEYIFFSLCNWKVNSHGVFRNTTNFQNNGAKNNEIQPGNTWKNFLSNFLFNYNLTIIELKNVLKIRVKEAKRNFEHYQNVTQKGRDFLFSPAPFKMERNGKHTLIYKVSLFLFLHHKLILCWIFRWSVQGLR